MQAEYELNLEDFIQGAYPAALEKALPKLKNEAEKGDVESLLIYSLYFCALNHCLNLGFEIQKIELALNESLDKLDPTHDQSVTKAKILIDGFFNYKIIREDRPLDDSLSEAIWKIFYDMDYVYPSFISGIIAFGLDYVNILKRCKIKL